MTDFTFAASVNGQQKQWFQEAISRLDDRFPASKLPLNITVRTVDEPPCVGHNDYMCTVTQAEDDVVTDIDIYLRTGAETQAVARVPKIEMVHDFFVESVVHEFGHVFSFTYLAPDDTKKDMVAGWFLWKGDSGTVRHGELADWNPTDKPWEGRLQEGLAEWFKDLYLDKKWRVYDNRTDWWFDQDSLDDWFAEVEKIICPVEPIPT